MNELTQEYLKSVVDYKDGFLYWKVSNNQVKIGDRAANLNKAPTGHRYMIYIKGKLRKCSRVIFFYHYGWWPEIVDHKDRDKLNDRIENLRAATKSQNMKNRTVKYNSSSKYLGVSKTNKGRWMASIQFDGKQKNIGRFETEEQAALAYNEYAIKYHGEFANPNIIK